MIRRPLLSLVAIVVLVVASGASCPNMLQQYVDPLPPALSETPTLAEMIEAVNANSAKIRAFHTNDATIKADNYPTLKARVSFQQSKRFRLEAKAPLGLGAVVDLGSNDELFWIWVRGNRPKHLYACRHDRFETSRARQTLPIQPTWLIEALGVVTLDPGGEHMGPERQPDGSLKIQTRLHTPAGEMTKVTVIDSLRGWVLEQSLYDADRRLIASAVASGHISVPINGDPANRAALPRHIDIRWPAAELSMNIDMGDIQLNRFDVSPEIWSKPSYDGWTEVDLGAAVMPAARRTPRQPQRLPPALRPAAAIRRRFR